jgi:hypothetical protein
LFLLEIYMVKNEENKVDYIGGSWRIKKGRE